MRTGKQRKLVRGRYRIRVVIQFMIFNISSQSQRPLRWLQSSRKSSKITSKVPGTVYSLIDLEAGGASESFYVWPLPERRNGSTRVAGHAFIACHSGWLRTFTMYITAAEISFSSQLCSSYQDNRYSTEGASRTAYPSRTKSLSSSQTGGPPCWASPLALL